MERNCLYGQYVVAEPYMFFAAGTWFAFVAGTITAAIFGTTITVVLSSVIGDIVALMCASAILLKVGIILAFYGTWFVGCTVDALINKKGVGVGEYYIQIWFLQVPTGIEFYVR